MDMEYENIIKCIKLIAEKYEVQNDEFILVKFSNYGDCTYSIQRTFNTADCIVLYRNIIQQEFGGAIIFIDYDGQKKIHFTDLKNDIMYLPDLNQFEYLEYSETREIDFQKIQQEYLKLIRGELIPENKSAKPH